MSEVNPEVGAEVFAALHAEYEQAWLTDVFIDPIDIRAVASMRSVLVVGESGSGKTALRLMLEQRYGSTGHGGTKLVAPWLFAPLAETLSGSALAQACIEQMLAACAVALVRQLGRAPAGYQAAPAWAQESIRDFIGGYVGVRPDRIIGRILPESTGEGSELLQTLALPAQDACVFRTQPPTHVIAELTDLVRQIQLDSIWILVDGLEPWTSVDPQRVATVFQSLSAALATFDVEGFAVKIFAPATLQAQLTSSSGITRRRLDVLHLRWTEEKLFEMVETRIANARRVYPSHLSDLCTHGELVKRLTTYGGLNPRAWLELARPYVETYLAQGAAGALSPAHCATIDRAYPPLLHVDLVTDQVFLGHNELTRLQPGAFQILRYLYENRARPCTRSEIYYRGQRKLQHEPRAPEDNDWEAPSEWRGALDTVMWRLHKQLEPDPKRPLYVVAVGSGFQLQHAW